MPEGRCPPQEVSKASHVRWLLPRSVTPGQPVPAARPILETPSRTGWCSRAARVLRGGIPRGLVLFIGFGHEPVTDAPYREDVAWLGRVVFNVTPQPNDEIINCPGVG